MRKAKVTPLDTPNPRTVPVPDWKIVFDAVPHAASYEIAMWGGKVTVRALPDVRVYSEYGEVIG